VDLKSRSSEGLAEFVKRIRDEKKLSLNDVVRQSRGLISNAHVSRIENGYVRGASPQTLQALARGLDVPEEELFAAARGRTLKQPEAQEIQLLTYFRYLPPSNQADLLLIARTLHRRHGVKSAEPIKLERRHRAA